jgi:hypothetical protein
VAQAVQTPKLDPTAPGDDAAALVAAAQLSWLNRAWAMLTRRDGRAPVWFELLVAAWLLWIYDQINDLAPLRRLEALHNAANVLAFERSINLSPELSLDHWVVSHATLGLVFSYYYVSAHFFVTFGLLAYMWWKRPAIYRPMRTQLVLINVIGLIVFWRFPVAPPRMLISDGFRDIIAMTRAVGDFHTGGLAKDADQYAAMPSLHIAWAAWSSLVAWRLFTSRAIRVLAVLYPFMTAFVVLATGNHFLLDVFAGAATMALAVLLELAAARWLPTYRRRRERHRYGAARGARAALAEGSGLGGGS